MILNKSIFGFFLGTLIIGLGACSDSSTSSQLSGISIIPTQAFVHKATAANSSGASTFLDGISHPEIMDPNTKIIVTQRLDISGFISDPSNDNVIAVTYNESEGVWAIINTNGSAIPNGARFNVLIPGNQGTSFIHQVDTSGLGGGRVFDHPDAANENARFFITPVYEEGSVVTGHRVSVNFGGFIELGYRWNVRKEHASGLSQGEKFHVYIPGSSEVSENLHNDLAAPLYHIYNSTHPNFSGIHFITLDTTGSNPYINENYSIGNSNNSNIFIRNLDGSNIGTTEGFNVLTVF
ncbi:MAG: hypothetical protein CL678_17685 [Bdellovibrionaceae bacterium]|nr:hypothetical protein [Pseudobdellovibrionaceae bacterium]|tara:strand:+ start:174 stop:1055 length:882 start_codon:yes stop_codon:yes gene_type:complete